MVWIAVRQRFSAFLKDLSLTADQISDGWTKQVGVGRSLQRAYYGSNAGDYYSGFMVGSWGKQTQVRPPRDVDIFFILPSAEKQRFDARAGNVQSAFLQEVKTAVSETYPQTQMRADGQVVAVAFNTLTIEVVPVFATGIGQYLMPDTNNGGSWKIADPLAQMKFIDAADVAMNGNVRALAKMLKLWKARHRNPC
jgi:SMODS domain-containing protein